MITMYRTYLEDRTTGRMVMPDGSELETLERPWKDNKRNISCIPEGEYIVQRNTTGRFQYYGLLDVPKRTHIEMHLGSKPTHSDGCILFPKRKHIMELMTWFGDDDWVLKIQEDTDDK